ncbi:MAG TPA: response regulator [Bryobacteraceae bacterium]|nr:response regulator [Bryobacteraceae bacterium]
MEAKPEENAPRRRTTVLLVEDNPTDVFVIKDVLKEYGLDLQLSVATDGEEAVRYLQKIETDESSPCPALVLLDLNLPRIAGVDVLRKLRSEPRCHRTPVIVVSSSIADSDRRNSENLGVEAYFQKPGDLDAYGELARIIKDILGFSH